MISVGLLQADIVPHAVEQNLLHYEEFLAENIIQSVDLLVLPEMFCCGFSPQLRQEAEKSQHLGMDFLRRMANQYSTEVVASLPILEEGKLYNRLVWMSPQGVRGCYDKRHLFFGDEQQLCTPGTTRTIVESFGYRFLPLICYDVRFPVWSRNLYKEGAYDYDGLIYVANFPAPRERVLQQLAVARAIENQAFTIVVNRVGKDGNGFYHAGGTMIIDPEGQILISAEPGREQLLQWNLDLSVLQNIRQRMPIAAQWD